MNRQIAELQQAEAMVQAQLDAASARLRAAEQVEVVADLRRQAAEDNLTAFDNQFFTPDVWYRMGFFMWRISRSYLNMAFRVARLMEKAYNFETDQDRRIIKVDYTTDTVKGLLGANALLLDIDSFTYDLITSTRGKQIAIKHTISLAGAYPFLFETQFRHTGRMEFETRIEDFDLAYPGTYGRRLDAIEVRIEGVLPARGMQGILTNSGISRYRAIDINQIKFRIQPRETLVLSEYRVKEDAIVFSADPRMLKVFEGAGVAGSWIFEIPMTTNDLDFNSITDVRLTFYAHARYNPLLAEAVKAQLAVLPGSHARIRSVAVRWAFPDAFFHFQDTGNLAFSLGIVDFPFNELDPQLVHLAMLVITEPGTDPSTWKVRLGVPDHPDTLSATPNATGEISIDAGHSWEPLMAGAAIGDYLIEIRADENPDLVVDNRLDLSVIRNLILIFEYTYTPRS